MDEVSAEIAAVKSALEKATEKLTVLQDGLVAATNDTQTSETRSNSIRLTTAELIKRAEELLRWSRFKANTLGLNSGLFADSCWNMCLDVYICDLKEEKITVSSIAHSSGIPMTTAMRYINVMAEDGLLEKSPNPMDNRMVFIATTISGKDKISAILSELD